MDTNQKIKPVPTPEPELGIDLKNSFVDSILDGASIGTLDLSSLNSLSQSTQSREQMYQLLDSMAQDDVVSAVLETYAEDAIQSNDKGESVWIESSDPNVLSYTNWLLDSLDINKHIYSWSYCLVTYGDVFIRLFRQSDYGNDLLFKDNSRTKQLNESLTPKEVLNEDVKIRIYDLDKDPYVPYVEMVPNPGEVLDLQKFGKTHGFIQAPVNSITAVNTNNEVINNYLGVNKYKVNKKDIEIFDAMSFAHGSLENTSQRKKEEIDIFIEDLNSSSEDKDYNVVKSSYSIKRGQSILYNSFKIWRELNLLEMSALLNRLTKSAVVRILTVEVGDMPKEQVRNFMERLKDKIEQKSAINVESGMSEYNSTGPIENTIYVPVHGGQGNINATTIGGDFDPKSLVDIEYFRDKLFGSLKVPKQFFGFTEDGAGFNGGTSLTILSSRYGKSIKKIQQVLCTLVTDIINLFLIDRGLDSYVNKFTVRMQTPITQEELDRRTNTDNRIRYVGDLMNQLADIEDKATKLKIYKALLAGVVNDSEVISYLQAYIDSLEAEDKETEDETENTKTNNSEDDLNVELESFENDEFKQTINEEGVEDEEEDLPSPDDLGLNLLDENL